MISKVWRNCCSVNLSKTFFLFNYFRKVSWINQSLFVIFKFPVFQLYEEYKNIWISTVELLLRLHNFARAYLCTTYLHLWRLASSRLESLLMTCDCAFLNCPKNLGQNRRQSICLKRLQNQSHFYYLNWKELKLHLSLHFYA